MKILVADPISKLGVNQLKNIKGFEVIEAYGSTPEQILELAKDVSAIIVRSETKVTSAVIDVAKNLKVVGRAGVGVDNIDIPEATQKGIIVMNTPLGNTIATAELTFTHMLCGTRPIPQANASMQSGKWNRKAFSGSELKGKTLAILGLGRIGSAIAQRAKAFEMKVIAYDPFITEAKAKTLDIEIVSLDEAFAKADYITIHMPLTPATKYMVNKDSIAKMKDGVRIFNCARGGIINEADLIEALKSGKVARAGLDVYESEPIKEGNPLIGIDNLVLTPHLGASTKEAQESCGIEIAEAITRILVDGEVRNAVNMPSVDAVTLKTLKPYISLGAKLGTFIQQMTPSRVEKLKISYFGKLNTLDKSPMTRAILRGYLAGICADSANDINSPLKIKELGIETEIISSDVSCDYNELIEVEGIAGKESFSVCGTVISKAQKEKIVSINKHDVEVNANGNLLLLENKDIPGIVGQIGSSLGKENVNIANMSLSRNDENGIALSVYELDSTPSNEFMSKLTDLSNVTKSVLVKLS